MARTGSVLFALLLVLAAGAKAAPQQEIGLINLVHADCHSLTIDVELNTSWEPSPNRRVSTYVVFEYLPRPSGPTEVAHSDHKVIELTGLQESHAYYFYVQARSRHRNGRGIPIYRKVGELHTTTPPCSAVTPFSPAPGDVRLRHEATGKCLYGSPIDGNPVGTWGCWRDPRMAISLESLGGAEVRIRVRATGKCLFGNPVEGREVKSWGCWEDPNMVYIREELGNNRIRLRHKLTGQCMYGGAADGDPVRNWPCWDDPNMVWVVDPF